MNSICITGAIQTDLQLVADILQSAGMQFPKPAKRGEPVDIALWHEQVMAAAAEESDDVQPIPNVGRLWEQLATDIFVANIESKLWGWSSARSSWLLDFWFNFEPRLNFILVCVSSQQMLASAMTTETDAVSVEVLMNAWQVHHQELLQFHHRNPQRSLLVDARECAEYPRVLIERCASQWKLPLEAATGASFALIEHDALALYLAQQLCRGYPQTASLQHELAATITRLGEAEQVASAIMIEPEQIIADYRALRDRSAELRQAQAAHEELASVLAALRDERETEVAVLIRARDEQGTLAAERQTKIEALTQERNSYAELAAEQQAQTDALAAANAALNGEKGALVKEKSEASPRHHSSGCRRSPTCCRVCSWGSTLHPRNRRALRGHPNQRRHSNPQ